MELVSSLFVPQYPTWSVRPDAVYGIPDARETHERILTRQVVFREYMYPALFPPDRNMASKFYRDIFPSRD